MNPKLRSYLLSSPNLACLYNAFWRPWRGYRYMVLPQRIAKTLHYGVESLLGPR